MHLQLVSATILIGKQVFTPPLNVCVCVLCTEGESSVLGRQEPGRVPRHAAGEVGAGTGVRRGPRTPAQAAAAARLTRAAHASDAGVSSSYLCRFGPPTALTGTLRAWALLDERTLFLRSCWIFLVEYAGHFSLNKSTMACNISKIRHYFNN